jgi:hypothetical protein
LSDLPVPPPRTSRAGFVSSTGQFVVGFATFLVLAAAVPLAMEMQEAWGGGAGVVLFGVASVVVIAGVHVGHHLLRRRRFARERRRRPTEPWMWDHPWDPEGETLGAVRRALEHGWTRPGCLGLAAFVLVPTIVAFAASGLRAAAFAALGASAAWAAFAVWRGHGLGACRVAYAKFPFHPGETVTLRIGVSEGGASFTHAEFHLRRIDERSGEPQVVFERTIRRPPGLLPGPEQYVELDFDVPATAGGTELLSLRPSYWVLDVVARTTAGPYCGSFLVPIYARVLSGVPA